MNNFNKAFKMKFILFLGIIFFLFSCDYIHETAFPKKKKEIDKLEKNISSLEKNISSLEKTISTLKTEISLIEKIREKSCAKEIKKKIGESVNIKEYKKHGNTLVAFIDNADNLTCVFDSEPKLKKPQLID